MSERRGSKRTSARLKVWCEGEDFTLLAETVNVSKGGMFVRTSSPPAATGPYKLTIEELGTVAEVEVRWVRKGREPGRRGMGLQILDFDRGAQAFEDYVDKNSSRSGEHKLPWPAGPGGGEEA